MNLNNYGAMRIKILLAMLVLAMGAAAQATKGISYVEQKGDFIYVYDEGGRRAYTKSVSSAGQVVGWSGSFWITCSRDYYYIWTADGKRHKTLSRHTVGEIVGVSGDTFTSRRYDWIYTYDKDGRRIGTRSAR